jgi:hypothetical protein
VVQAIPGGGSAATQEEVLLGHTQGPGQEVDVRCPFGKPA